MEKCQVCGLETKKESAKFCSIQCKSISQKIKKEKLDPSINIRCKTDGKIFIDYENRGGTLFRYSRDILNKEFDWNDWEQIRVEAKPIWKCPYCDWESVDLENKSGQISIHLQNKHDLNPDDHCSQYPSDKKLWKHYWAGKDRVEFMNESEDNRIQCLECGKWFKKISNTHLRVKHNLSELEYIQKHGQNSLSSASFREKMSQYLQINGSPNTAFKSKYEDQICEFLDIQSVEYIRHSMKMGFEIDIFIPGKSIGIEFNGLFFHSEFGGGKLKYYHRNKTEQCEKAGIHLIHVFEDEWLSQKEIVKSRLKNILGLNSNVIFARKCDILEISFQNASKFLEDNHLQGKTQASAINLGLYYREELVSVMTFGALSLDKGNKQSEQGEYELKRFCSKLDHNIIGGASRLLSFFEKKYNPVSLLSFANRSWTTALGKSVYDKMGFTLVGKTDPNYWYLVEPNKRTHRFTYTKGNILKKFKTADPALSEIENMRELGFDRIWDCGSLKYVKLYDATSTPDIDLQTYDFQPKIQSVKRYNRKKSKDTKRKIADVECDICGNEYSIVGMYTHLKLQHNISPDEYVVNYPEYRPKYINESKRLSEVGDQFKCRECDSRMMSNKQLVQHVNKFHGSFEEYAIKFIFNGNHPTCQCGCGERVGLKSQLPYSSEYISGHNPNGMAGKKHRAESIEKQKEKSIGRYSLPWFIDRYGEETGRKKYAERNQKLSDRNKNWKK